MSKEQDTAMYDQPDNVVIPPPYQAPILSPVEQGKVDVLQSNARIAAVLAEREAAKNE